MNHSVINRDELPRDRNLYEMEVLMGKVVLDITMSLDGFVAGPNDEIDPLHDWIFAGEAGDITH